jgi:hypothetical protein
MNERNAEVRLLRTLNFSRDLSNVNACRVKLKSNLLTFSKPVHSTKNRHTS